LTLKVKKGQIYGIIGPNGAGKTTLFNCITGIYTPEEGEILWNGVDIKGTAPHKIAELGILPTPAYKKDERYNWEKVGEYMDLFGLREYATTPAGDLSYGVQRKIEMARALAAEPELLILDEPAAGLNENETKELADIIRKIQAMGVTIMMIEHDMDMVMSLCEYMTVINFGAWICEGVASEVQNNPAVIEAYIGAEDDEDE